MKITSEHITSNGCEIEIRSLLIESAPDALSVRLVNNVEVLSCTSHVPELQSVLTDEVILVICQNYFAQRYPANKFRVSPFKITKTGSRLSCQFTVDNRNDSSSRSAMRITYRISKDLPAEKRTDSLEEDASNQEGFSND